MRKIIFVISGIVFGVLILFIVVPSIGKPRYSEQIAYYRPAWLSNDEIAYVKVIEHGTYHYDRLSSAANEFERLEKKELQICSTDINGSYEKIIKNIVINYKRFSDKTIRWEDKAFEGVTVINYISVNYKRQLIAFSADCFNKRAIFLMNFDGTNTKKITYKGYKPKLSPNGTKILYVTARSYVNSKYEDIKKNLRSDEWDKVSSLRDYYITEWSLWSMDTDGSNREKIISDSDIYTFVWHPDGERIIYVNEKEKKKYIVNLSDKSKEGFNLFPGEQNTDGAKIIVVGNVIYYGPSSLFLKLKNIPSGAQFSPDGTKLVGGPTGDIRADICVVNADGTGLKALKISSKVDH